MADIGRRVFLTAWAGGLAAGCAAPAEDGPSPRVKRFYRLTDGEPPERVRLKDVRAGDVLIFDDEGRWWSCVAGSGGEMNMAGVWQIEAEALHGLTPVKGVPAEGAR